MSFRSDVYILLPKDEVDKIKDTEKYKSIFSHANRFFTVQSNNNNKLYYLYEFYEIRWYDTAKEVSNAVDIIYSMSEYDYLIINSYDNTTEHDYKFKDLDYSYFDVQVSVHFPELTKVTEI